MAQQVWNALNSLSRTMRDRGGVTDAQIRGIDATTGLKRAEYEIGRGIKADARAETLAKQQETMFNLQLPEAEAKAKEAAYQNEMITINAKDTMPNYASGQLHFHTPRTSDGKSLFDDVNEGLPGSGWDDKTGLRKNSDGSIVKMPRWKWEQRYKKAMMFTYISKIDPAKMLNDKIFEARQALDASPQGTSEWTNKKAAYDKLNAIRDDDKQMASLYMNKMDGITQGLMWGIQNNADPRYFSMMSSQFSDAKERYDRATLKMTPAEKATYDKQMALLDKQMKVADSAIAKNQKGDKVTTADKTRTDKINKENFMLKYGLKEGLDGGLSGPQMTAQDAEMAKQDAQSMGLNIYFDKGTVRDTGSGWNPFDNKDVEVYTVRGVAPGGSSGTGQRQGLEQPGQPTAQPGTVTATPTGRPETAQPAAQGASWKQYLPDGQTAQAAVSPAQPTTAGLVRTPTPAQTKAELIPGMRGNMAALGASTKEAAGVLSMFADAIGLGADNFKAAAKLLADAAGFTVEELYTKPVAEIESLAKELLASQAAAQQTVGGAQPYGFR